MKKASLLISLLVTMIFSSFTTGEPDMFMLNASGSTITWASKPEEGTSHNGTIKFKSGNLKFQSKTMVGGFFYINMQSFACSDIADEGFNNELIQEMRAAEILNVVKYKESTLKITKAKRLDVPEGKPNFEIQAIFNLKGLKKPVSFPATVDFSKKKVAMKADLTLAKGDFQLPYDINLKLNINTTLK